MRIEHSRSPLPQVKPKESNSSNGSKKLSKPELISDLFNNRIEDKESTTDSKVRLSFTAQSLVKEFNKKVSFFLSKEKKIAKELENIPLPDSHYTALNFNSNLVLRKLSTYMQWLNIYEGNPPMKDNTPAAQPFLAIHKEGKNEEITQLYQELQARQREILSERKKNVPNYFYLTHPETYAFN